MDIVKIVGVIIRDRKYLVARDTDESFFKNVGGKLIEGETDLDCLKRELKSELGLTIEEEPEKAFELPPTPAVGDPGLNVVIRGYVVPLSAKVESASISPAGDVAELAWVNSLNLSEHELTPQITDLIIPKLKEQGLID